MNRLNVFLISVLTLLMSCTSAYAGTNLLILTDEETRYEQADIDTLLRQINNVPVYEIDYSSTDTILKGIHDDLLFVESLGESEVLRNERAIQEKITRSIGTHKESIQEAVRQRSIGGELSHRYGIDELPTLIEIDDDGNYRLIEKPTSLLAGVVSLNSKPFAREPNNVLSRNSQGRNQNTKDNSDSQLTAVARAVGDVVNLVLNGELVTVPFDAMFTDQFVVDNGTAPDPADFVDIAFVIDTLAIEDIVADNPAFIYTGVDDLADYVLEQLDDGNYIGLVAGELPVPPPVIDPETGNECLSVDEAIEVADAFGNTASFNPCTGDVLSVYVYDDATGNVVECLVASELSDAIAEAAAVVPDAASFNNCTGEVLTIFVYDGAGNATEVDYVTGLPSCLSAADLATELAAVPDVAAYDACTGEIFSILVYDAAGVATEVDYITGLPYVDPLDPPVCLGPGETNPVTDAMTDVITVDPCTGDAVTIAVTIGGEVVEVPVGDSIPVLDCLILGETAPDTVGINDVVAVDPCTGEATIVNIMIEGVLTPVPVDELIDPLDTEETNDAINQATDDILAANPGLPPSDDEVITESVIDEILVDLFTDTLDATSTVTPVEGGPITSYGSGVRYSILDAMLDGNLPASFNCLNIRITGSCIYVVVRIYCSPFGCSVETSLEGSLQVTHGNPDLLIAAYPRQGASPITEARELFGRMSLEVSKLVIESLTGYDVPDDYMDTDKWGASDSDTDGAPGTRRFNEVDVIGHPGTFYSFMSADDTFPIDRYIDRLKAAPQNIYNGLAESFPLIGPLFSASIDLIFNGGGTDPAWPEEPRQRLLTADGSLDKGFVTWGKDGMVDERGQPRELFPNIDAIGENFPTVGELAGSVALPSLDQIRLIVDAMFFDGALTANDRLIAQLVDLYNLYNDFVTAVALMENIMNIIEVASDPTVLTAEIDAEFGDIGEIIQGMADGVALVQDIADFGGDTELWSMCPSGSEFFKPYMLSGMNSIQWKFNVPEILFPQTYIPPFPFFKDYYVGDLSIKDAGGFYFPNAWGSIYPRVGYVTQTDRMKAAAVTAGRAAHVVTRDRQLHAYSQLPAYRERYLDIEQPPAYKPRDVVSGKWQLVAPQVEEQCIVFSEDDGILNPWTSDKQGPLNDHLKFPSYVFAFWRDYTCCPEPRRGGALIWFRTRVATLDIPSVTILD